MQLKGRSKLGKILAVAGALVLVVVIAIVAFSLLSNRDTESDQAVNNGTQSTDEQDTPVDTPATDQPAEAPVTPAPESTVDPAQVATVDIVPMTIVVPYVKGVGGFDYEVLRTASGTKYVQFSSSKLVGTKCTDDIGQFASIIEKPSADEATTLAKTTTIDGVQYGLSLADATCTSDADSLKQYQTSFSDAFSLLKKM